MKKPKTSELLKLEWQIDLCHGVMVVTKDSPDQYNHTVCTISINNSNHENIKLAKHIIENHNKTLNE